MNLYFLVEGASTEAKFYPALIKSIFDTKLKRILKIADVNQDNDSFYILSANGYPQIYSHILKNTIEDLNQYKEFNYLFICLDADEMTIEERHSEFQEVYNDLKESGTSVHDLCEIILVIQNRCIETWFLGNKRFYRRNTSNHNLLDFHFFYNIKVNDPEEMSYDIGYENHASYHYAYLKQMIRENRNTYSKKNATVVCEDNYIQQLKERAKTDQHIKSFGLLIDKLNQINQRLLGN